MKSLIPSLWTGRAPADPFFDLRRDMDAFFNRSSRWPTFEVGAALPALNVAETGDSIEVTAELPGVEDKDISVDIDGNRLIISGEKKAESEKEEKNWHVMERSYGSFQRSVVLPFEPSNEACEAHFDKGVLRLTIAKPKANETRNRKIEIKSGSPNGAGKQIEGEANEANKPAGDKAA